MDENKLLTDKVKMLNRIAKLRRTIAVDDERLLDATDKIGFAPAGYDTADLLANEILGLRAELAHSKSDMSLSMIIETILAYPWVNGLSIYTEDGSENGHPNVVYGAHAMTSLSDEEELSKIHMSSSYNCPDIRSALEGCLYSCKQCHQLWLIGR